MSASDGGLLDSIDRSELYNPVYPVDGPISEPDVASVDEKYVRIRITSESKQPAPTWHRNSRIDISRVRSRLYSCQARAR